MTSTFLPARAGAWLTAFALLGSVPDTAAAASTALAAASARPPDPTLVRRGPPPLRARAWSIHAGYFGEFGLHPGGFAGAAWRLVGNRRVELLVQGTVASWVHRRNSVGLAIAPELAGRVHLGRRVALEASAGVGYLHSWLAGRVFELDDDGVIRRAPNHGRAAVMPTGSLGVAIETRHVAPLVRLAVFGQYPYDRHMLAHIALMLGVRL